jgi:aryl-alcohol dehydrogenase-like predicted oxidoreductase
MQPTSTTTRVLGRSGIEVSAVGMGCWAIGGPWSNPAGVALGWGEVDDAESVRAVQRALDLGITFFDTADTYGAGHSERVLGQALAGQRDRAVIATKWGVTFDEQARQATGQDASPEYLRRAVVASLRRLGTDYLDLYQLHIGELPPAQAADLQGVLEELVAAGTIRAYGWSTDSVPHAQSWARAGAHYTAVQHAFSVLEDAPQLLAVCDQHDLASINRGPLAMGLLTGKYSASATVGPDDVRGSGVSWMRLFQDGRPAPRFAAQVAAVRDVLTSGGRTLAQGALGWILARSPRAVPIPGCRTVAQVEENAAALAHGPLTPDQLNQVASLLPG